MDGAINLSKMYSGMGGQFAVQAIPSGCKFATVLTVWREVFYKPEKRERERLDEHGGGRTRTYIYN